MTAAVAFVLGIAAHGIVRALLPLLPRCGANGGDVPVFGRVTCRRVWGHLGAHRYHNANRLRWTTQTGGVVACERCGSTQPLHPCKGRR